jgi:hypothetical protein
MQSCHSDRSEAKWPSRPTGIFLSATVKTASRPTTGSVKAFLSDPLGNPVPWFPLRGTTGPEGAVAADGYICAAQVTSLGLVRYSLK